MVAVARYGLILWENEAAGVRKVFRYLPDLWDTIKKSKMAAKVNKIQKHSISGVNGVAMDRHGLILWENDATGSRKVFRYLPGLWDTI